MRRRVFQWRRLPGVLILAVFLLAAGFPFLVMLSVSLQDMDQIYASGLSLWPDPLVWDNYRRALTGGNWPRYLGNSFFVAGVATAISLFINAMTGYAFARIRFPYRRALFVLVLAGMMIPTQVTLVPLFIMIRHFPLAGGNNLFGQGGTGLVDTLTGLILPYAAGSFGVFMCRQFYVLFPAELDEAAKIDGCSRFGAFISIYLPLSAPVLGALAVLKFTGAWNEYTWPLVMTNTGSDRITTVQLALTRFRNEGEIFWNQLMAATLTSTLVILAVFLSMQKYFVSGLLAGSIKE
ncbi:MAG: carbohydrate ABC transporter permease [Clostridiaceae bacterium]|nr:carbohydrate ABC transporter permease [Clostridiaceae bacterium]